MERFVLRVAVIVLLGSTLGLAWGLVRETSGHQLILRLPPQPARPTPQAPTGPTGPSGATGQPGMTEVVTPPPAATGKADHTEDYFIPVAKAKELYDQMNKGANIVFVDAREFVEFKDSHIAGAMSIPKRRFDGAVPKEVLDTLPGNTVVVYCHGELCTDSEAVVKRLIALNLQIGPFYIIKEGLPGWEKAGYPMEGDKVRAR